MAQFNSSVLLDGMTLFSVNGFGGVFNRVGDRFLSESLS